MATAYELRYDGLVAPISEFVAQQVISVMKDVSPATGSRTKRIGLLDGSYVTLLLTVSTPIAVVERESDVALDLDTLRASVADDVDPT